MVLNITSPSTPLANRTVIEYGVSANCAPLNYQCTIYNTSDVLGVIEDYNVTARPWYITGVSSALPAWTPIYLFATSNTLGASAVVGIVDYPGNQTNWVCAVDVLLSQLSDFLVRCPARWCVTAGR